METRGTPEREEAVWRAHSFGKDADRGGQVAELEREACRKKSVASGFYRDFFIFS